MTGSVEPKPQEPPAVAAVSTPVSMFPVAAALEVIEFLGDRPKSWKAEVARQLLMLLDAAPSTQPEQAAEQETAA